VIRRIIDHGCYPSAAQQQTAIKPDPRGCPRPQIKAHVQDPGPILVTDLQPPDTDV